MILGSVAWCPSRMVVCQAGRAPDAADEGTEEGTKRGREGDQMDRSRTTRALPVALLLLATFFPDGVRAEELAASVTPANLYAQRQKGPGPFVLDVRTPAEFQAGHLPGAVNIPHDQLAERIGEVPRDREIAVYCMVGPRARLGEKTLQEAGVSTLLHLEGGFAAWRESGLPVEPRAEE